MRHFAFHTDQHTLRCRIAGDFITHPNSSFRLKHLEPYVEEARRWPRSEAKVVDSTNHSLA